MDILFNGVGIDCNREDLEASIVCPNLGREKGITVINETYYSVSIFGEVRKLKLMKVLELFEILHLEKWNKSGSLQGFAWNQGFIKSWSSSRN